jgi:hypothetical protein
MKDLLLLTADKDAEFTLKSLINKIIIVENINQISFDIITHPQRDPGVAKQTIEYIRPYITDYRFVIILYDHEGSGKESIEKAELESSMENDLANNGWREKNTCILFEPELESWLWVNKQHLHSLVDWQNDQDIYQWINKNGFDSINNSNKPTRPKEAFEAVLKHQKIPRSSSLYSKLAETASYQNCIDDSFDKFIKKIREWFSKERHTS